MKTPAGVDSCTSPAVHLCKADEGLSQHPVRRRKTAT